MEPCLAAKGVSKRFAGAIALNGVDFDLFPGEVHALIGENGAGKSTLINILTGVLSPDAGELRVNGAERRFASTHEARNAGIHVIHQELAFVPHLDVATNLALGDIPTRAGRLGRLLGLVDLPEMRRRAAQALERVGSPVSGETPAGQLSVAQLQLMEIARSLTGDFRIIFFDEPTSSLGNAERDRLFQHVRRMVEAGIGVVYTSHRMDEILELADRVTILKDGSVVDRGPAKGFDIDRIVHGITGRTIRPTKRVTGVPGDAVLELADLHAPPAVQSVDLSLRAGEIVGIAGLIGAGRTELAECIYGVRDFTGSIRVGGRSVSPRSPAEALKLGIAFMTEDRKTAGLFHDLPAGTNIAVGALRRPETARQFLVGRQWLRRGRIADLCSRLTRQTDIRPPDPNLKAGRMSGGNQQKVVFARLIASKPRILIVDEPTRGVDVAAKAQIWSIIHALADQGVGVLAISSDVQELVGNVDRALVMRRGRIVAELPGKDVTEEEITRYAV